MSLIDDLFSVFKRREAAPVPPVPVTRYAPPPPLQHMGDVGDDERAMLRAIQAGDDAHRAIYADWLEDRGRHPDAEYVRAELAVQATAAIADVEAQRRAAKDALDRFHFAGRRVATDFKAWLSRPTIEKCLGFDLKCPLQWNRLAPTDDARVRDCSVCQRQVRFCETVGQARQVAATGGCVAVELSLPRRPGDLNPPQQVMMMGRVARQPR